MSNYVVKIKKKMKEEFGYDYMDPLSDVVFKSIFSKDKNHILIKILVKELLGIEFNSIKVKHPGFVAKGKNIRGEEADYYFEVDNKNITIECNKKFNVDLFERNISHLRRMIIDSDEFNIVQIHFDNYDIEGRKKKVYKYNLREESINSNLYKDLISIYHINLSYFTNYVKEGYNDYKKLTLFEKMCLVFLTKKRSILEKIVSGDDELMNVKKAIEDINSNEGAWKKYTKAELTLIAEVEEASEKARQEARKEAIIEGREEGRKEKQLEIARNMIEDGMNILTIKKYTNLSEEELKELSK